MGKSAEADRAADGRTGAEREELAKKLAAERIQRALEKIERAQNLLNEAAAELCPIVGLVRQWNQISKLGDDCKARWYALQPALKMPYEVDATALHHHVAYAQQGEGGR